MAECVQAEQEVLTNINCVLSALGMAMIERVSQLYHEVDQNFLTTIPELDPYGPKVGTRYMGVWLDDTGVEPQWPAAPGKRIFAYLKNFPALPELVEWLASSGHSVLLVGDGLPKQLTERTIKNIRFESRSVCLRRGAKQCDLAILNATHITSIAMLSAGKSIVQIPLVLEQTLTAQATERLGVAIAAPPESPERIIDSVQSLVEMSCYTNGGANGKDTCSNAYADSVVDWATKLVASGNTIC